jgi:hypothetical protein
MSPKAFSDIHRQCGRVGSYVICQYSRVYMLWRNDWLLYAFWVRLKRVLGWNYEYMLLSIEREHDSEQLYPNGVEDCAS